MVTSIWPRFRKSLLPLVIVPCFLGYARLSFSADGAESQEIDGNVLLRGCNSLLRASEGDVSHRDAGEYFCLGLVLGIDDTIVVQNAKAGNVLDARALFCSPARGKIVQSIRVVVKYLNDHPERLNERSSALAIEALMKAFPCKGK